jgi:uncharacterized protein (TIGR02145 family)
MDFKRGAYGRIRNHMLIHYVIIYFIMAPLLVHSQKEWNNWCFGQKNVVCFNSGSPFLLPNSMMVSGSNMPVTISDSAGNLLFYANGYKIWDRTNAVMPNGSDLRGNVAGQPVFVVPMIPFDSTFYLFTVGNNGYLPPPYYGLYYSIVDMRLNNGYGAIPIGLKNIPVLGGEYAHNHLTGVRHKNNQDVWVIVRQNEPTPVYLAYLITSSGIILPPITSQSIQPIINGTYCGFIRVSPDGTKLFSQDSISAEYCLFDNETGIINPLFLYKSRQGIDTPYVPLFAEFSIDSKFIYSINSPIAGGSTITITQYDATATDSASFMQSEVLLGYHGGMIQMSNNGKIYITSGSLDSLHVINYPSQSGVACNLEYNVFGLEGNLSYRSLPQFLQKYKAYIHHQGTCLNDSIHFSGDIWPPADTILWNFGDPASGAMNISYDTTPSHVYSTPGIYTIELYVRHIDNRTDTSWINLEIFETPNPQLGNDTTVCQGDSVTFNAGSWTDCTYSWENISTGQTGIGSDSTLKVGASGIYAVTVASSHGCTGYDTIELTVVSEVSVIASPSSLSLCSGDTTEIQLQGNLPGCSFTWTAGASSDSLSGYANGSGSSINQTLYNTDTLEQTATYAITPYLSGCTGIPLIYSVGVSPRPNMTCNPFTQDICSGQQAVIHLTSDLSGTTYSWNAEASSPDISGYSSGTGSTIDQTLINAGSNTDSVIYHITPVASSGCSGDSSDAIVSVIPTVTTTIIPPSLEICSGDTTEVLLHCNVSGCSFSWIATASSPGISGYAPGTGDTIQQTLTNSTSTQQTVTYSITPDVTGCGSITTNYTVAINPQLPVSISISPDFNPVCEGLSVTYSSTIQNGGTNPQYQWIVNGNPMGTNHSTYSYIPTNGDQITCTLTSSETCTANNPAISTPISMMVVDKPAVSLTACFDTITTTNAKPILLRGGVPLGGTYTGSSVGSASSGSGVNYFFDPSTVGPGTYEITYNYINSAGCEDSAKKLIFNFQFSIFNCGDSLTDIRDNHTYPTTQIGTQCWMASNLNYGTEIPLNSPQRDNCTPEKYYPVPCALCSALYQWDELMQYRSIEAIQGLCPPGWHVPSESDWQELFNHFQGNAFAGSPLLSTGYSGFNAILSGAGLFNQNWYFSDFATIFWSSTSHGPGKAWAHGLNEYNHSVSFYPAYQSNAFSVRCVQN